MDFNVLVVAYIHYPPAGSTECWYQDPLCPRQHLLHPLPKLFLVSGFRPLVHAHPHIHTQCIGKEGEGGKLGCWWERAGGEVGLKQLLQK